MKGTSTWQSPGEKWHRKIEVNASHDEGGIVYEGAIGDREVNAFALTAGYEADEARIAGKVGTQQCHMAVKNLHEKGKTLTGTIGSGDYELTAKAIDDKFTALPAKLYCFRYAPAFDMSEDLLYVLKEDVHDLHSSTQYVEFEADNSSPYFDVNREKIPSVYVEVTASSKEKID